MAFAHVAGDMTSKGIASGTYTFTPTRYDHTLGLKPVKVKLIAGVLPPTNLPAPDEGTVSYKVTATLRDADNIRVPFTAGFLHLSAGMRVDLADVRLSGSPYSPSETGIVDPTQPVPPNLPKPDPASPGGNTTTVVVKEKPEAFFPKFLQSRKRAIWSPSYWWADWWNPRQNPPTPSKWEGIMQAAGTSELAVLNISSGSGDSKSDDWVRQANLVRQNGVYLLGYVRTTWGNRPAEEILAECKNHLDWYEVDGFFLDEYPNGWGDQDGSWKKLVPVYQKLKELYPDKVVIGNPGTNTTAEFVQTADVLMTYEQAAARYLGDGMEPNWNGTRGEYNRSEYDGVPAWRFWHCIHDVKTPEQAIRCLRKASTLNVRAIYLTDDTFFNAAGESVENPYNEPPSPWLWALQNAWAEGDTVFETYVATFYPQHKKSV